jgi:hypothetical protein
MIEIHNHGPLITASNYWDSEMAAAGKIYVSVNAGAIRMLLPSVLRHYLQEQRPAQYAILSRGPWPAAGLEDAVEILWEDGTKAPFSQQLHPVSFDFLPAEPEAGKELVITVWVDKKGFPHKSLERRCLWRRVPSIPWLKMGTGELPGA